MEASLRSSPISLVSGPAVARAAAVKNVPRSTVTGAKGVIFTPGCPPSPARRAVAPTDRSDAWITSWLTDIAGIYPDLTGDNPGSGMPKPKALVKIGYNSG